MAFSTFFNITLSVKIVNGGVGISLAKRWSDTNPNKRLNEPFRCEMMSRLVTPLSSGIQIVK